MVGRPDSYVWNGVSLIFDSVKPGVYIFTVRQRSCWKVMFSDLSVHQSFSPQGVSCNHNTWCNGPHPTHHYPIPRHGALLYRDHPSLVPAPTASDIGWPRLESYSNLFTWGPPSADIRWLPKPKRSASRSYGSYGMLSYCFKQFLERIINGCLIIQKWLSILDSRPFLKPPSIVQF